MFSLHFNEFFGWQKYIDSENEFCGGNVVNDERRRFKMKGKHDFEEIDPLISWMNLTYIGSMNMGATICGVKQLYLGLDLVSK